MRRLGLSFNGVFRQAASIKGRKRDTAWFDALDDACPALTGAFITWLSPSTFFPRRGGEPSGDITRFVRVAEDLTLLR